MSNDTRDVIVRLEDLGRRTMPRMHIHHRDFPELWAEGVTADEGARQLADRLRGARDWACELWRREALGGALADVEEYLSREIAVGGARV